VAEGQRARASNKRAQDRVGEAQSVEDDDLALIGRALAGESSAFEKLVRRYEGRVYRTVVGVTGNAEDAEEATQDTFVRAYLHLSEFRGESRFSTWLTRIAVNEGLQCLRRRKPMESLDDPSAREPMPQHTGRWYDDPETRCSKQELRRLVEEALASLPVIYRTAFILRDLEDLSNEEAAAALGVSVEALKSRVLRARLMLREALAPRFERPQTLKTRLVRAGWKVRGAAWMMRQAISSQTRKPTGLGEEN
jgi:RNA polymerase sigma-70 factor (ECF subfamily)